jgi:hypothetical protein
MSIDKNALIEDLKDMIRVYREAEKTLPQYEYSLIRANEGARRACEQILSNLNEGNYDEQFVLVNSDGEEIG